MPDFKRTPYKFLTRGLGLSAPPDLLPSGYVPILLNVRPDTFGTLTTRQPLEQILAPAAASPILTLRRLNDPTNNSFARVATDRAGNLMANGVIEDTGYSGNPTVMVPFRPLQTPRPWMYVSDSAKMRKIRTDGVNYLTGIVPPNTAAAITLGAPNYVNVADFRTGGTAPIASWTYGGTAGAASSANRFNTTISQILYDAGTTGWASVVLATMDLNVQPGAFLYINNAETVIIHEVFPVTETTTIAGIVYDFGTTGLCAIVLTNPSPNLQSGSVIKLNTELVTVISVTVGQDGIPAFRCSTTGTHAAGETVTGYASLRAYTTINHTAGQTVTGVALTSVVAVGTGTLTFTSAYDLSTVGNRPITTADYLHISILLDTPDNLVEGQISLDIGDGSFTQNYYYFPFTQNDLQVNSQLGDELGDSQWVELKIPLSQLIRAGTDETKTLANVDALQLQFIVTATTTVKASSWWVGGTYGPDSSELGTPYLATYRWRASTIGTKSNPAPETRYGVTPARERLVISGFAAATDPQVDTIDVFISGGQSNDWTLAASIPIAQTSINIDLTNAAQQVSETLEFDNFVPFPTTDLPRTGMVNVTGTSVSWVSGDVFNLRWTPGSSIIIAGVVYTLYDQPESTTRLQIVESAGQQSNVQFSIPEATLQGTPLPYTCDGGQQNNSVIFGAGDPDNPGILYWTNPNNPDGASDSHNLEITSPSEPLFMPFVWNGQAYVYSSERLFVLSSAAPLGTQRVNFAAQEVPGHRGLYSPWFSCVGPVPYFGGKDGIYSWAGGEPTSITDDSLYPLFPHAGVPGVLTYIYYPIDMSSVTDLQLFWADSALWFCYRDTIGTLRTMRYDFTHGGGWFPYDLNPASTSQVVYGEEGGEIETVITGSADGSVQEFNATGAELIDCRVRTAALDQGDTRAQKLYTDAMVDLNIPGLVGPSPPLAQIFYDNFQSSVTAVSVVSAQRAQIPLPIAGNSLLLHRNIALDLRWFGPGTLYEFQPAAEMQPYLSVSFINQAKDHGFTTYGYLREGRLALISADTVVLTAVVDGSPVILFTAASTNGNYRKLYFPAPPLKGKLIQYKAESPSPFALYPEETMVSAREWGAGGPFVQYKPFAGMMAG